MSNLIFYSRDDQPVTLFGTHSNRDTLLARAAAKENLSRSSPRPVIHEIGPGNFNFAKTFVGNSAGLEGLIYTGHDFQDAQYDHSRASVENSPGDIRFKKNSIDRFPGTVSGGGFSAYLVEVLDDTLTEFFTLCGGQESMICSIPEVLYDEDVVTRAKFGADQIKMGNCSRSTQRMANTNGRDRGYSPQELAELINNVNIDELMKLHPGFLRNLGYEDLPA